MQEELKNYWVALNLIFAEDLRSVKKIVENFPKIPDVFEADIKDLINLGIEEEKARELFSSRLRARVNKEIEWLLSRGYSILTLEDEDYPEILREIFDPPLVLYCAGKKEVLRFPSVSIVGSRKPSPYGRGVAERLARDLSSLGLVVVSGLARGIDCAAHWGALEEGRTVAVLGSGLRNIYPRENRRLFERIIENGAVVTEFPGESPPLGFHFPIRNRIISGLSFALVVVEATLRSGSLISARLALEQNREVMAVPGNVTSPLSQGTHWLIKNGAKLVENWKDVVEELPTALKEEVLGKEKEKEKPETISKEEEAVLNLLHPDSLTHIDEMVEVSRLSVSEILSHLLSLELKGYVNQFPGKYFQRKF